MKKIPDFQDDLVDWIDALENQILFNGRDNAKALLSEFINHANKKGLVEEILSQMPFENSISHYEEIEYPGDWEIEAKNKTLYKMECAYYCFKSK